MKVTLWLALIALSVTSVQAQLFSITNRSNNSAAATAAFNALENAVNNELPDTDATEFLDAMSNAGVMAASGVGADYASDFDTIVVGGTIGVGVDVGDSSFSDIDAETAAGVGATGSILVGTRLDRFVKKKKLWFLETDRTKIFGNFFFFDVPEFSDDIDIESKSLGFRAQYKLVKPKQAAYGVVKWNGVDVTTGFQYTKLDFRSTQRITESIQESGVTGTFDGTANLGAEITTLFVPVEVTTGARLLYLLNFYGGLGFDISFGSSDSIANISGPVNLSGAVSGSGTATLDLGQDGSPDFVNPRALLGLQLDFPIVKLFVQANANLAGERASVNTGVRFVW